MRKAFIILVAMAAVVATGSLLFLRNRANEQRTAASIGLGLHTPTPTPSPTPGTLALTDVNTLIKNMTPNPSPAETRILEGGLQIQDALVGTGAEAVAGAKVAVHYTGRLEDGTVFDSSIPRKQPFAFVLGTGSVIKGWDVGVAGMKVGGKRTLIIPSAMGYGSQGAGGVIPPNATLIFEVELLDVQTK